ncbi:hypothetical protein C8A03DRAFT_30864 [Achaetomium macrosporum]|uniref:Uncharacterized protein n=1 Tax=Achaetomium macrosporum TaxID=79813 RepID=A0AAN7HDK5_9PEZI|nr:hypothetical protein C8A03DRAFT_30864 [Achaetomium macrosporum]
MGVEGKKRSAPPLPAPTETNSTLLTTPPSDVGTELSKSGDEKSSYSLPDDGTPVTIKTGHRASRSQTSLLIEYFEGGKASSASGATEQRKPSVRVRLTPSSKHKSKGGSDRDRIQITQTKSRKTSLSRRSVPASGPTRSEVEGLSAVSGDMEDAGSYASATEESTVSRNPIDIEIDRSGNVRRRRPASPLIPAADSKASYHGTASEISAIPADSFLDGSGPATSFGMSEVKSTRSRSPSRTGDYLLGAAAGLGAAAAAEKLRNKSREERERDRVSVSKSRESRDKEKDRRHRSSKSRTSSLAKEEKYAERSKSPRRRSKGHSESLVSAADSSVVSSAFAPSHRSVDQHSIRSGTSKASSINNPKLLETVEDAIRRLILPELNALKREQSRHKTRRDSTTSSTTTVSKDDYASDRRRSGATDKNLVTPRDSMRSKESRDREARNDFDDSSALSHDSVEDDHDIEDTPIRSTDRLKAAAAGAAMGAAAVAAHEVFQSPSDDKQRSRRRRRAEMRSRGSDHALEDEESELGPPVPPMPLMSDVNASDVTRASILSAETDRPHSATEEIAPGRNLSQAQLSASSTPTPTRTPVTTLQALGTQHANVSHGDLKALPNQRTGQWDEYVIDDNGKKVPSRASKHYQEDEEYDDNGDTPAYAPENPYDYYSTQDVPPPLKYVPYQPERRGLSPIPSVSGYTEAGSEGPNRESRATHRTNESVSSAERSPRQDGSMHSRPSREFVEDERSRLSSVVDQENAMSPPSSELDRVTSGQAVRAVAMNPDFVHPPGIESNVASLVDGSMLEGSALTTSSSAVGNQPYNGRESMATLEEEHSRDPGTPTKRSVGSQREYAEERAQTSSARSQQSREFVQYELDEYGRKVPQTAYRQSPTVSEAAITSAAVGAAAAVLRAKHAQAQQEVISDDEAESQGAGVQRNKSFKERTKNGPRPGIDTASAESLINDAEKPKLGFSSMPDPNDPMPEIGDWQDDDLLTNPSLLDGHGGRDQEEEHWAGDATPRQHPQHREDDVEYQHLDGTPQQQSSGHDLAGVAGAAAAVGAAAGMAAAQSHSRQPSQEHDEWYRDSEDKKRDTIVTNPYEGSSPIANLPGINNALLGGQGFDNSGYGNLYGTRSPLGHKVDEGYISQGPNKTPDIQMAKGKGVDSNVNSGPGGPGVEDPFFTSNHNRHLSGMSQGMGSPLYDAATGTGIERIESKDIIALMQHLMVRDAQRSARDTEILVTLVRSATEMRNNFEDLKRLLADTEDVIITEVKENTEKSVQRAINGPRPYPGSARHSIQGSQAGTINGDDVTAKKRSIFRRALKGLSAKGANDLGRIEDMLMQLLNEVDVLKAQTAPGNMHGSQSNQGEQSYDHLQPDVQDEQDHGYEPEGHAGTSTTSHASQSGYLSIQSHGTSVKQGYDYRKVSAHRISTVPEDNEEDCDHGRRDEDLNMMTPAHERRGGSVPLGTPPGAAGQTQHSMSNENTPRTEDGKKRKSGRSSWFRIPRISRWSETTASSGVPESGHSKQSSRDENVNFHAGPSRSGSLDHYQDNYQFSAPQPVESDKLHTGFSETDLAQHGYHEDHEGMMYGQMPSSSQTDPNWVSMNMTPEEAKYKAHRDSLNLVHPQPRQGQTERFKAALESQALGYDSPLSPKSADWAGSATSLNRFGGQHQHTDSYGSAGGDHHYQQQHWTSSSPGPANMTPTAGGPPPRPPKEALDQPQQQQQQQQPPSSPSQMMRHATPPQNKRLSKLQHQQPGSPLPHHSVESGYGTMTHGVPTASYISHGTGGNSPRLENRNLSGALGRDGVNRRPSGPRPMTPTKGMGMGRNSPAPAPGAAALGEDERRKRDTFGTMASQDTETF